GRIERVEPPGQAATRESFLHVAVPRIADAGERERLAAVVRDRLADVVLVTEDFGPMLARAQAMAGEFEGVRRSRDPRVPPEATAIGDFLRWLVDGGFVFLGYREYAFADGPEGRTVELRRGSGLGLLRREEGSHFRDPRLATTLPPAARRRVEG